MEKREHQCFYNNMRCLFMTTSKHLLDTTRYVGVIWFNLHVLQLYRLDIQNKTHFPLANLRWTYAETQLKHKFMFVNLLIGYITKHHSTMGVGFMSLEYVNYIFWGSWTNWEYPFAIHTFKLDLETWGGVILLALSAWITNHLKNMHRKHRASQYDSLTLLLIEPLSLKIPTLFTIFYFVNTQHLSFTLASVSSCFTSFFSWK